MSQTDPLAQLAAGKLDGHPITGATPTPITDRIMAAMDELTAAITDAHRAGITIPPAAGTGMATLGVGVVIIGGQEGGPAAVARIMRHVGASEATPPTSPVPASFQRGNSR